MKLKEPLSAKIAQDALIAVVQSYTVLGTPGECKKARDKQKPMRVTEVHTYEYRCPACKSMNATDGESYIRDNYCPICGQRLEE